MENEKINETILKNLYKNAQMAVESLDGVIPVAQGALKEELLSEHDGYEKILTDISLAAHNRNVETGGVGAIAKTMLGASIKMKTIADDSDSHIAEMTLKGTVMGITELIKDISEYGHLLEGDVFSLLEKLKNYQEECEEKLKKYL